MEKAAEQVYTDLLRQLASPSDVEPGVLADAFSDVERMHSMGQITDWQLQNAREAYATTAAAATSQVGDRPSWVVGKAKDALHGLADAVGERSTAAAAAYTKQDPLRAVLIAAGTGALLMVLLARVARSGVRTVRHTVRR